MKSTSTGMGSARCNCLDWPTGSELLVKSKYWRQRIHRWLSCRKRPDQDQQQTAGAVGRENPFLLLFPFELLIVSCRLPLPLLLTASPPATMHLWQLVVVVSR